MSTADAWAEATAAFLTPIVLARSREGATRQECLDAAVQMMGETIDAASQEMTWFRRAVVRRKFRREVVPRVLVLLSSILDRSLTHADH